MEIPFTPNCSRVNAAYPDPLRNLRAAVVEDNDQMKERGGETPRKRIPLPIMAELDFHPDAGDEFTGLFAVADFPGQ